MAIGEVRYNRLKAGLSDIDIVDGKLSWVSSTSIKWAFEKSNQIKLFNGANWDVVKCSTEPTLANNATAIDGTSLQPGCIYDIFAEYNNSTSFTLKASKWSYGGSGANNSSTSYATPVMTSNTTPGPVVVSASEILNSGSDAWVAFNQDISGGWVNNGTMPAWLSINFGVGICINKYLFYTGSDNNVPPSTWSFQGSNDNSNWTTLHSLSSQSLVALTWYSYDFINKKPYQYYRLYISSNNSGNVAVIRELKLVADSKSLPTGYTRIAPWEASIGYLVGDRVTSSGNDYVCHTAHTSGGSFSATNWTLNGTSVTGENAGLYRYDGVLVSDSSTTGKKRRFLGTVYAYNNGGTVNFREVELHNIYNTPIISQDVVGGRLDLVSSSSIKWNFQNNNQIKLYSGEKWKVVNCNSEPLLYNSSLDLNGTQLQPNTIYDIFAEYSSEHDFKLSASRWSYGGDGANNSSTSYATPVMTANNAPGPVVVSTDSDYNINQVAWKAFNQTCIDSGDSWASADTSLPHWIKIDTGNAVCINKYSMQSQDWASSNYFPSTFTLSGSNDNSSWTELDSRTGISWPGQKTWTSYFTFSNQKAYRYYKLNVTTITAGSNYVVISELKLVSDNRSLAGSSSRVSAYESTVPYAIGDRVTYGGHDWVKISDTTDGPAGTTPVAGNDWVDNGTSVSGDFAGLYRHNGVLVSDSSTTGKSRRWLGIIYTYNNSGTVNFKDDVNYRFVSNFYNRKDNVVSSSNSNSSWTLSTINTYVEYNGGSGQTPGNFIACLSSLSTISSVTRVYNTNSGADTFGAIALNNNATALVASQVTATANYYCNVSISYNRQLNVGYNYITGMCRTNNANAVYAPIIHPYIILQG